jgi:hypothetical protein
MQQLLKTVGISVVIAAAIAVGAHASTLPQETFTIPDDRLAVTVASAKASEPDPLNSELTIWVGEIEIEGRKTIWVELIDSYGEVIYDSEVGQNETHLLPDGRAVVVTSMDPATTIAKEDTSRVESEGQLVITRRVVNEGEDATAVEFIEATKTEKKPDAQPMASVGETIWTKIVAFFQAAADRVQVAWNWLVGTVSA